MLCWITRLRVLIFCRLVESTQFCATFWNWCHSLYFFQRPWRCWRESWNPRQIPCWPLQNTDVTSLSTFSTRYSYVFPCPFAHLLASPSVHLSVYSTTCPSVCFFLSVGTPVCSLCIAVFAPQRYQRLKCRSYVIVVLAVSVVCPLLLFLYLSSATTTPFGFIWQCCTGYAACPAEGWTENSKS